MIVATTACRPHLTTNSLSGTWVAEYKGATERLILNPNGTYRQEIVAGDRNTRHELTNEGQWRVDDSDQRVILNHALVISDGYGNLRDNYRSHYSEYNLPVEAQLMTGRLRLGLSEGVPYMKQ